MADDLARLVTWHNGEKSFSPFSEAEMARRQNAVRDWMGQNDVDACLFTSYHCINYYAGFVYCYFGRKYGFVIDRGRRHFHLRRDRRRTALAPNLWGQRHLYRLAQGQLFPCRPDPDQGREAPGCRIRPHHAGHATSASGRAARRGTGRCRSAVHVDAHDQVGGGACPDPQRRTGCRYRRRRGGRGRGGRRVGA